MKLTRLHYIDQWFTRYNKNKDILVLCSITFKKTAIAAMWFFFSLIIFACRIMIIIIPIDSVKCRASNFSWHVRCLVVWMKISLNIVSVTKKIEATYHLLFWNYSPSCNTNNSNMENQQYKYNLASPKQYMSLWVHT